jgi:hypothetical protein
MNTCRSKKRLFLFLLGGGGGSVPDRPATAGSDFQIVILQRDELLLDDTLFHSSVFSRV